jgi:hypothetical protein
MITGWLSTMPPFELFQWLGMGRKTGTLTVTNGRVEKKITFHDGFIISTASSDPGDFLGVYLVQHAVITPQEHEKARELQEQLDISLGKILVMIGALSEEELVRLLRNKAEEEMSGIFSWHSGTFSFDPSAGPSARQTVPLQIDVARVLLEGSRRSDERTRFREALAEESWDSFEVEFNLTPEVASVVVVIGDGRRWPKYHRPSCRVLEKVKEERRRPFHSVEEAQKAGLGSCKKCGS